jgi:3-hydroxyacyl-[acyl-carrier-protein] dehydratase
MTASELARALQSLPHGESFRFVTELTDLHPGESASGLWNVAGDEWFLRGHFPNRPIVPGVLIAESLAQIAGLASLAGVPQRIDEPPAALAHLDLRFHAPLTPPCRIDLRAKVLRRLGDLFLVQVEALSGGRGICNGSLAIAARGDENNAHANP